MTVGRISSGLFILLVISSLWRKRFRIHYDEWSLLHIGVAIADFLLAVGHIEGVGFYINAPVKHAIWTGFILFWLLLVVYMRLIKPWRMRGKPYRVEEVRHACCNSWTLTLHIKEHPFSISSSSAKRGSVEFTVKELGDFTRTINQTQVGEVAYLDGLYGVFTVDRYPDATGFVFIAGGIGVAPIISMLRTLADREEQRPLLFIYGNKSQDDMLFKEELETLQTRLHLQVVHVLSNPSPGWSGESGWITMALLQNVLANKAPGFEYFLCGPKPMSNAVQKSLHDLQVPLRHIHFELFDMV